MRKSWTRRNNKLPFDGTMKLAQTNLSGLAEGGKAIAPAFWTAPALWRFSHAGQKAAEGCRTPKPRGISVAAFGLSRRDSQKTARRFNAGNGLACASSPAGTAENARPFRPSHRDLIHFVSQPGVKTQGYSHSSRRDKTAGAVFSAGGAHDSSPRRQPWVTASSRSSSGRSERTGRNINLFLPPLRGLRILDIEPFLSPLRGCEMPPRNETTARN